MRFSWLERFAGRWNWHGEGWQGRRRRRPRLASPEPLETRALLTAQLQIQQTGIVQNTAAIGQLLDDTYQITNIGSTAAINVTVTDTLPVGVDLIAASTSTGTVSEAGSVITAQLGNLAPGATVTVDVQMTPNSATTLTNQVSAKATNATIVTESSTTTGTSATLGADLQVSGSSSPSTAVTGQDLRYTFTVANNSSNEAQNALLTTALPAGVVFVSAAVSGQNVGHVTDNNGVVTASLGSLGTAQSETVVIDVMPTATGSLTALAFATDSNGDTNLANNGQTQNTTVNHPGSAATLLVSTAAPASLLVGQAGQYTITVSNIGAGPALNVTLWEQIPAGAAFLYATASQGAIHIQDDSDRYISAELGDLGQSKSATITLWMTPLTTTPIVNQAVATTDSGVSNLTTVISSKSLTPASGASAVDLSVSTSSSASSAYLGQALTYTITLTNLSSTTASNVLLTDPLPGDLTFVSAQSSSGTTSGGTALGTVTYVNGSVLDKIGSLAGGKSVTLTLVVTPTVAGQLANTAIATTDNGVTNTAASVSTNSSASGTAVPSSAADLVVTKTDSANGASVNIGQQVTYTITVKNQSPANSATNVVLTDMLPAAESYVSSNAALGTITQANGVVTDNIGNLAPGQTEVLHVTATVTATGSITNTAVATTDSGVVNPATIAGSDTLGQGSVTTGPADLAISLAHSTNNGAIVPGQALTYTVTVTNTSNSFAASGVQISNTLPAGVTLVSAASVVGSGAGALSTGTVTVSGGSVVDNLGTLGAGQTATLTLIVMPMQAGGLTDSASVSSTTSDPNTSNNSATDLATVATTPATAATLSIAKTPSPTSALLGATITYTITVTNTGSQAASNVVVTDLLPSAEQFSSGSATVGTVSSSNGYVTDDIGTLAGGASATITVMVTTSQTGVLQNTAIVTTDSGVVDPASSIAQASVTVSAGGGGGGGGGGGDANVVISNAASPASPFIGLTITYTITVHNTGTGDADSLVVTDVLPPGLTLVSDSTTQGTISVSGGTLTVDLGLLTSRQSATITFTATASGAGTISDTASYTTTSPNDSASSAATATVTVSGGGVVGYLPGQPGDNTDATFISNLYRELLDRNPDAGGEAYWLSFLQAPGSNPILQQNLLVQAILGSNEYQAHFVELVYQNFLHRLADSGGLQFFVGQLSAGIGEQTVISEVISSPEYVAEHGGTPQGFVDGLYQDLLGRAADAGGETYWVNQLTAGSANTVNAVQAFLGSSEADRLLIDNPTDSALAALTDGGWNELYFQGNLTANAQNLFFSQLASQAPYQQVISNMLQTGQYFNAAETFLP
ncbi:MAG TPA: DUF4214 domain-containing protein [Pirellulales bacterium]|nr:DUF4214 domain-containing protein [Pirellulales bacterium]